MTALQRLHTHRNRLLAGLLSAAFTLALAAPALGDVDPASGLTNVAPVTEVYADAMLTAAVAVGDRYWARVGVEPICAPEVFVYDEQDHSTVARGDLPGCRVYFDRAYRNYIWTIANDRSQPRADRLAVLDQVCAIAAHERGHNHGFGHAAYGVMTAVQSVVPNECAVWSRLILPLKRNRDKRARRH